MTPTVVSVREQNTLNASNQIVKAIVITYKVGPHGPFTLYTNQTDINNGTAARQMQEFANTLAVLPGVQ